MALFKDQAIALRRIDYSESSQVLAVFCREQGLQRLIAKGIKRGTKTRVAVGVDLLECGQVVYSRRPDSQSELSTMTEWRQVDAFGHIRSSLRSLYAAQYAAEITAGMTEVGDPHPELFDGLGRLLQDLSDTGALEHLLEFMVLLLTEAGVMPRLDSCVSCDRESDAQSALYFTSRGGGLLCRDCEPHAVEKRGIGPGAIEWLMTPLNRMPGKAASAYAAFELLDYHVTELMGRRPSLSEPVRATCRTGSPS